MNVLVATGTESAAERMQERLQASVSFTRASNQMRLWELLEATYDAVVVDAALFADAYPWEWIGTLAEKIGAAKAVVFADETIYDSLWFEVLGRLADRHGIAVAPYDGGVEGAAAFVEGSLLGERDEKAAGALGGIVSVVFSASSRNGATSVALNTAVALATHTGLRIGLVDLNLKNPELRVALQLPAGGHDRTNLSLRPKLQTAALAPGDLLRATVGYSKLQRLHILPGTSRRDTASDVTPEMVTHLIDVCRHTFDITVLDVSGVPDNAATVCSVRQADVRWLVANNRDSSCLWSWREWYECYWKLCGLKKEDVGLVLNRYDTHGEPAEKVARALGMPLAAVLAYIPREARLNAVRDGLVMQEAHQATLYAEGIRQLASELSVMSGGAQISVSAPQRKNGFLQMLSGLF